MSKFRFILSQLNIRLLFLNHILQFMRINSAKSPQLSVQFSGKNKQLNEDCTINILNTVNQSGCLVFLSKSSMKLKNLFLIAAFLLSLQAISQNKSSDMMEKATLGAGCFWCVEAIFERLKGVDEAISGYSGGEIVNPSYREVSSGNTGHAEVVQVFFDPEKISYKEILEVYWKSHDPTQLNRQGADVGPQYRSVIFYHNEDQRKTAEKYKQELEKANIWDDPIVTAIEPFKNFFKAEDYHQEYYENNKNEGYCQFVITPKIEKFKKVFSDKVKDIK